MKLFLKEFPRSLPMGSGETLRSANIQGVKGTRPLRISPKQTNSATSLTSWQQSHSLRYLTQYSPFLKLTERGLRGKRIYVVPVFFYSSPDVRGLWGLGIYNTSSFLVEHSATCRTKYILFLSQVRVRWTW